MGRTGGLNVRGNWRTARNPIPKQFYLPKMYVCLLEARSSTQEPVGMRQERSCVYIGSMSV